MSKKSIILISTLLVISFSAGIFVEIVSPTGKLLISTEPPTMVSGFLDYIISDIVTILAAMFFSGTVFLMPAVIVMVIGKTFSLGFSAAFILSSFEENALGILLAALLPRGLFKIPAYIGLILICFQTAKFIYKNYGNPAVIKQHLPTYLRNYFFCFIALAISSLLEAFLLQGVL